MRQRVIDLWQRFNQSERSFVIFWLALLAGAITISGYVRSVAPFEFEVYWYFLTLFIVNSVIFFSLFRDLPTIKIVMLVFLLLLEFATVGYYFFNSVNFII